MQNRSNKRKKKSETASMTSHGHDDVELKSDEQDQDTFILPNAMTRLRACLRCKIVLSSQQFIREGCPNCTGDYGGDRHAVEQLTTRNFSGTAAIIDPARSWVSRNIKADDLVPGVYAIAVQGGYSGEDIGEYDLDQ